MLNTHAPYLFVTFVLDDLCFVQVVIDWLKYSPVDQITHARHLVVK